MNFMAAIVALLCLFHVATCLRVNIHAPGRAISKSTAHLECNFELENEKQLDSVKMLKDDQIFYLFAPNENDRLSSVPGIIANDVVVTKTIGSKSGQILFRLVQVNPESSGSYACEVETKDPAYRYTSVKEMIVSDPAPHKETIVAQTSAQKENIVAEPLPQENVDTSKNSRAYSSQNSTVAITVCAIIAFSINYVARVTTFLK